MKEVITQVPRATQPLLEAVIAQLIESDAANYIEDQYQLTVVGREPTTAVVTIRFGDKPTPHELRQLAETRCAELEQALALCVASLDQQLPFAAKAPVDIGLLNEALCAARPLLVKAEQPATT